MQSKIHDIKSKTEARGVKSNRAVLGLAVGSAVAAAGIGGLLLPRALPSAVRKHLVYAGQGYGGYVGKSQLLPPSSDPIEPLRTAYRAGHYTEAEQAAEPFEARARASSTPAVVRQAADAELIAAYSAARCRDFPVALARFDRTRTLAADLTDHGARPFAWGTPSPTLEEEAAFEQVVCVGAEGETAQAEAGYRSFLERYPRSILIHAALKRVARLHKGDVPQATEALWQKAVLVQRADEKAQRRAQSLCGPECLAELLRRQGKAVEVETLARQMKTDETGTSLGALAETAKARGLRPRGVQLSAKGLAKQRLPLIALVHGGHFVVVDRVEPAAITVWDPDANGVGKAATRTWSDKDWTSAWSGIALTTR